MCIYITHTHAHARFAFYALLSRDLWHLDYHMFNERFIFVLHFYWLILPRLDCHVNHDWLHIERILRVVPKICADRIWDGLGPSIYIGDVMYTEDSLDWFDSLKTDSLYVPPFLRLAVPSSVVQRIEGERCLWANAGDLRPTRVPMNQISGKCARTTARALSSMCSSSTVSSYVCARDPL
jgi:hypothetical protein